MTVLAFERHPVAPGRSEEFESVLEGWLAAARRAPGALWADAAAAFDDPPSYLVLSEWRTEADLDAWEAGDEARTFAERADPLLREDPTRRRFAAQGRTGSSVARTSSQ